MLWLKDMKQDAAHIHETKQDTDDKPKQLSMWPEEKNIQQTMFKKHLLLKREEGEKCDASFLTVLHGLSKSKSHL